MTHPTRSAEELEDIADDVRCFAGLLRVHDNDTVARLLKHISTLTAERDGLQTLVDAQCHANEYACRRINQLRESAKIVEAERDAALANARTPGTVEGCSKCAEHITYILEHGGEIGCTLEDCPIRAAKALPTTENQKRFNPKKETPKP